MDSVVVVSLACWRPKESVYTIGRATAVLLIWFLTAVPATIAMGSYTDMTLSEAGEVIGDGKIVVLKPETWSGKRFPLLSHIDIGDKLANGLWLVLLHRHDCSACREAASQYKSLARDFSTQSSCPTIALVECPPYDPNAKTDGPMVSGHVDNGHEWKLSGPTSVLIDEGQVRNVFINARDVELVKAIWDNAGL